MVRRGWSKDGRLSSVNMLTTRCCLARGLLPQSCRERRPKEIALELCIGLSFSYSSFQSFDKGVFKSKQVRSDGPYICILSFSECTITARGGFTTHEAKRIDEAPTGRESRKIHVYIG